ncbi:MAG: hypothetical protein IPO81_12600 [Kouleothrix sp.]|nr:hypothetical protein [Kouleothrix sp.]
MQPVTEQVDAAYLEQPPPRPIPLPVALNVLADHTFEQPIRIFLNPWLIAGVLALLLLFILHASPALRLIPVIVVLGRLVIAARQIWRRVRDDLALLRSGLTIRAHVLRLRPHRTTTGEINGALLDCAIPVAPRRTYVGSVWVADGAEAVRLAHQGRVQVICLPRTPGTWRVIEQIQSEIRYDRMGPMQQIPPDL